MRRLLWLLVLCTTTPAAGAVLFSDTFNRADTSGTMQDASGKQWADVTATAEISANKVRCSTATACSAVGALESNNTTSQADTVVSALLLQGNEATSEVLCRNRGSGSASRNFMSGYFSGTTTGYRIDKVVAGTRTTLTVDAAATRLASARVQLSCVGSTFNVYENGVLIKGPVSDTSLPTGVPGFYDAVGGAGAQMLDNFAVCDAVAECDAVSATGGASSPAGGPSGKSLLGVGP